MAGDPRSGGEIAAATAAWVHENIAGGATASWLGPLVAADAGMTTFIWFGQLVGDELPAAWREQLALRVFGTVAEDEVRQLEHSILQFVAAADYPVPVPLASVPTGTRNPVGLPWLVLPRVPGDPLLAVITRAPWAAPARLRELAALQVRLHAIPPSGCPLPADGALVDRWLDRRGPVITSLENPRANAVFDGLVHHAALVRDEHAVVCHGDFHPLNVLSRRDHAGWHHVVIDWTDAVVGDRHFDVARTLALFRVAWIVAGSPVERSVLKIAGPGLARIYRKAYERGATLDPDRLAYWSAVHYLYGWWQITQLHDGAFESTRAESDTVPPALADALLDYAEQALATLPSR